MGVKNIQGNELREKIKNFLNDNFDLIQKDFKGLDPVQRVTFYERILKYGVPVLKNIEIEPDVKEIINIVSLGDGINPNDETST